ncbi:MAG: hypothetical protein HQM03_14990 [Magnetococcales bacterium]|nr:hypothetical protein [Magnetococcales bacterium]
MARHPNIEHFFFYRGDTQVFPLQITSVGNAPVDITGHEWWFTMKRSADEQDRDAVFQKRIVFPPGDQSTVGEGALVLHSSETRAIEPGIYLYDMQHVIPGFPPIVATLMSGQINVLADITRSDRA